MNSYFFCKNSHSWLRQPGFFHRSQLGCLDIFLLATILLCGLGLRIFCWSQSGAVSRDASWYLLIAERWFTQGSAQAAFSGESWTAPLLPWLIQLGMYLGGSAEITGLLLNLFSGTLLSLIVWAILYRAGCRRELCLAGALLIALHPSAVELSIEIQRDSLYLFWIGLTILGLENAFLRPGNWLAWCLAGACCGFAATARLEGLEAVVVVPIATFITACADRKRYQQFLWGGIAFLLVVIAVLLLLLVCMGAMESFYGLCQQKIANRFHIM